MQKMYHLLINNFMPNKNITKEILEFVEKNSEVINDSLWYVDPEDITKALERQRAEILEDLIIIKNKTGKAWAINNDCSENRNEKDKALRDTADMTADLITKLNNN